MCAELTAGLSEFYSIQNGAVTELVASNELLSVVAGAGEAGPAWNGHEDLQ